LRPKRRATACARRSSKAAARRRFSPSIKTRIAESEKGRPTFNATRAKEREHLIERVGAELREMMAFLDPVRVKPGG